jgi:hypothetical protein
MLKNGLEQQPAPSTQPDWLQSLKHDNVHGDSYFH